MPFGCVDPPWTLLYVHIKNQSEFILMNEALFGTCITCSAFNFFVVYYEFGIFGNGYKLPSVCITQVTRVKRVGMPQTFCFLRCNVHSMLFHSTLEGLFLVLLCALDVKCWVSTRLERPTAVRGWRICSYHWCALMLVRACFVCVALREKLTLWQ